MNGSTFGKYPASLQKILNVHVAFSQYNSDFPLTFTSSQYTGDVGSMYNAYIIWMFPSSCFKED